MADKKVKGAGDRFLPGSNIAKHREWRGLKDTWYDYVEWVKVLGIMGGFVAKSPVRIARGMLTYRWMGSYLGALNMIDRCVEGLRGVGVLRVEVVIRLLDHAPQFGRQHQRGVDVPRRAERYGRTVGDGDREVAFCGTSVGSPHGDVERHLAPSSRLAGGGDRRRGRRPAARRGPCPSLRRGAALETAPRAAPRGGR